MLFFLYVRSVVGRVLGVNLRARWATDALTGGDRVPKELWLSFRECVTVAKLVFDPDDTGGDAMYADFLATVEAHCVGLKRATADTRRVEVSQFLTLAVVGYHQDRPEEPPFGGAPPRGPPAADGDAERAKSPRADVEEKARRIAELESVVASLKKRIATIDPGNDVESSLEDLERQLQDTARKLLEGDETVESELERLDKAIRSHPEHAERLAVAAAKWEASQKSPNDAALAEARRFVPRDIFKSTATEVDRRYAARAQAGALPAKAAASLAKRVWTCQTLWLLWLEPERIKKLHPADLRGRYAAAGLDVVELRAVYAVLPETFDNDPTGDKTKWRSNIRTKLEELVNKEARGALSKAEARHAAYRGAPPDLDVNDGQAYAYDDKAPLRSLDDDRANNDKGPPADRPKIALPLPKKAARDDNPPPATKEKKKKAPKAAPGDLLAALKNRENKRRASSCA